MLSCCFRRHVSILSPQHQSSSRANTGSSPHPPFNHHQPRKKHDRRMSAFFWDIRNVTYSMAILSILLWLTGGRGQQGDAVPGRQRAGRLRTAGRTPRPRPSVRQDRSLSAVQGHSLGKGVQSSSRPVFIFDETFWPFLATLSSIGSAGLNVCCPAFLLSEPQGTHTHAIV